MTLEQRVAALELAIANMAVQQRNADELSEMVRNSASEAIKNACRAGGVINAAQKQAAKYEASFNISIT
ncbi:hypothetical protein [Enterobacter cloacae]|uniref:hypothetical protein n=1 Tax=Enterobacter cloacae TaxID=550 RepID=UPI0021836EBA|nr:hypothetical protein [Enterobacter cloacae]MCT2767082.1 hypothetical protein [Enterobacter cloacae]